MPKTKPSVRSRRESRLLNRTAHTMVDVIDATIRLHGGRFRAPGAPFHCLCWLRALVGANLADVFLPGGEWHYQEGVMLIRAGERFVVMGDWRPPLKLIQLM